MYRLIGSLLMIGATTGAGILYGKEQKGYWNTLREIREVLYLIKGELLYTAAPLGEIFFRTARKVREPYKGWMTELYEATENRQDIHFSGIWNHSIDKRNESFRLRKNHILMLKEIGMSLGMNDRESEGNRFTLHLEQLEREIDRLQQDVQSKIKIGNCLGVMSGIFMVLILI